MPGLGNPPLSRIQVKMLISKHSFPILLIASGTFAAAQELVAPEAIPFPMESVMVTQPGVLEFELDAALLDLLTTLEDVTLLGTLLPSGQTVDLNLRRLDFDPTTVGVQVDGAPSIFDPKDLTLWKGDVVGLRGSHVFLALSSHGTYGWINDGLEYTHISAMPGVNGSWASARGRMYSSRALAASGTQSGPLNCAIDELQGGPSGPFISSGAIGDPMPGAAPILELKMAVETDFQLYKKWSNLQAEETYVMALLGAVSDRYQQQIEVKITFPYVQFWNKVNDPWTSQDSGGGSVDLLYEFRDAWAGKIPAGAKLAHFLSGANLGGGVAWLGVLCNSSYGFAVSGNINGGVTFPVTQGSNTWDFFVMAHETGHNVGSPHTQDWCPPLDLCVSNCTGQTQCTNQGTNMSYCHLCGGGMNNITTFFHPTAVTLMRNAAVNSCLPVHDPGTPVVLFADDFESGNLISGGWTVRRTKVRTGAAHLSTFGARIRQKGKITRTIDTTGHTKIVLQYWRKTKNYDATEKLLIRWFDGAKWRTLERTTANSWGVLTYDLPVGAENNPNFAIRFKSKADLGNERGDVDSIVVTGSL